MLAVIPEPLAASRREAFPFDSSIVDAADGVSVVAVFLFYLFQKDELSRKPGSRF